MKERHIEFLIRFHKPTSRQLNLLSDGGVISNSALKGKIIMELKDSSPMIWLFTGSRFLNVLKAYFYIFFGRSNLVRLALRTRLNDWHKVQKQRNIALNHLHKSLER